MKIHNIEQGTDEWFALKLGKMSASHAQAIASQGKGLNTYILELVSQRLTGINKNYYTNKDLQRGIELENEARDIYGFEIGYDIEQIGFVEIDEYVGCSPDGFVNERDGLVEIKCPKDSVFTERLIFKKPESKYIWQCQMQMLLTGKKWCDLVYYNPNFKDPFIVFHLTEDKEKQNELQKGIEKGKDLIKDYITKAKQGEKQ